MDKAVEQVKYYLTMVFYAGLFSLPWTLGLFFLTPVTSGGQYNTSNITTLAGIFLLMFGYAVVMGKGTHSALLLGVALAGSVGLILVVTGTVHLFSLIASVSVTIGAYQVMSFIDNYQRNHLPVEQKDLVPVSQQTRQ